MPEGIPENEVSFNIEGGHDHDGDDSTKINFSKYDLYDFVDEAELEKEVRRIVNSGSINPIGGVVLGDGSTGSPPITLAPEPPSAVTGVGAYSGVNEDGSTYIDASWDPASGAVTYSVSLYRSEDSGSTYLKVNEVVVSELTHRFDNVIAGIVLSSTRYKLVVYGKSNAGISGSFGSLSPISPASDSTAPSGPSFSVSVTNFFVSFRGFLAKVDENTEADMKWGIGQYEWSVSTNAASDSLWTSNEVKNVRATGQILSATGLDTGSPYYLRVRAIDSSNNNSPWTYWVSVGNAGSSSRSSAVSFSPSSIMGGSGGASEIAAGTIVAGDILANTISADEIETDFALVNNTIRSNSFTSGVTGWRIRYDGTAEFNNNVTMRGATIRDGSINITSGGVTKFNVDTSGNTTMAGTLTVGNFSSGAGMNWDGSTLYVKGDITGSNGIFSGTLSATVGTIGGWTISPSSLSKTSSSGGLSSTVSLYSLGTTTGMSLSTSNSLKNGFITISESSSGGTNNSLQVLAPTSRSVLNQAGLRATDYNSGYSDVLLKLAGGSTAAEIKLTDSGSIQYLSTIANYVRMEDTSLNPLLYIDGPGNKFYIAGHLYMYDSLPTWTGGAVNGTTGYGTLRRRDGDSAVVELVSSRRFKTNIVDIPKDKSRAVDMLRPVYFNDIGDADGELVAGLIAEEVYHAWPEAVNCRPVDENDNLVSLRMGEDGIVEPLPQGCSMAPWSINYDMLVVPLIMKVQDLEARIAAFES